MQQECFYLASCKGKDEHQGIVESEFSHVVVTVQCALAVAEVFIGQQQAAVGTLYVLDDILVSAISVEPVSLLTPTNTITTGGIWGLLFILVIPAALLIYGFVRWMHRRKL